MRERDSDRRDGIRVTLLGCNNGLAELEKEKESILSISNVRQGFLDAFVSFGSIVNDAFGISKETTKKGVGDRFGALGQKIQEVLEKVKQITTKEGDSKETQRDILLGAVKKANDALTKLKENLDVLAKIGGDTEKVGEVTSGNKQGAEADPIELKRAYNAFKGIVEAAQIVDIKEPQKSSVELDATGVASTPHDGAKVLTTGADAGGSPVGEKASLIVSTVSGDEILAEIVKSQETDVNTGIGGGNADASTSALAFAKGHGTAGNLAQAGIKPGAVSAGIALRSLVKSGKLASKNDTNDIKSVQLVGATAASKLVGALETLIIKTVNKALEGVKRSLTALKANGENTTGNKN